MSQGTIPPQTRTPPAPAATGRAGRGVAKPPPIPFVPTPPAQRKVAPTLFGAALVTADTLALAAAVPFAYWLRFGSGLLPTPLGVPSFGAYAAAIPLVVVLGLAAFREAGLYRATRRADLVRDTVGGLRALVLLAVLLAALAFFYREFSFSRTFLLLYAASAALLFVVGRRAAGVVHRTLRARGIGVTRVVLAGGEVADRLAKNIAGRPGSGLEVVARLSREEWHGLAADAGGPARLAARLRGARADRLIVTESVPSQVARLALVETCHEIGARCDFVPDLFETMLGRVRVEEFDGVPLVGATLYPLGTLDRFEKRTLDLVVAGAGLVVLAPLFAALAIAVRLESDGPALFRQRRIGRDGREFDILKFRSMPVAAEEETGPVRATRADERPTRLGRALRRTSLDELPQLWNVLRGEMSLVGPRPERPHFVGEFHASIPRYLERHGVKSGITGWAQVHGLRGDTSIEERTRYDLWYVENWSLALDLKILVLTLLRFLFQEEAY